MGNATYGASVSHAIELNGVLNQPIIDHFSLYGKGIYVDKPSMANWFNGYVLRRVT